MTPAVPHGDPSAEGSDGGASHSSQFELVEEQALSEEDAETQGQPEEHGTEADAAASSAAANNAADSIPEDIIEPSSGPATSTQQPQQQLEQAHQQHGDEAPSSNASAAAQATGASPGGSKPDGFSLADNIRHADEISHADQFSHADASPAQHAAEADSSPRPVSAEPSDAEFKQLEERAKQVVQVAQGVQDMASNVSKSLQAGLFTALGSATDATSNIGSLSLGNNLGKLSNWWSNLDATMAAGPTTATPEQRSSSTAGATAAADDVAVSKRNSELVELVGLEAGENLVESFGCKLVQTYACSHNSCTPAIQMTFAGTLFITDRHACFIIEDHSKRAPIKIALSQVDTATRERGAHRGDASDVLKIVVRTPSPAAAAGASTSRSGASAAAEQGSGKAGSSAVGGGLFGLLPPVLGGAAGNNSSSGATHGVGAGSSSGGGAGGTSGGGYWVAFRDFEGPAGLDNALALVEHLREGT